MKLLFTTKFLKQISKFKNRKLADDILKTITEAEKAALIQDINNIKKLSGHKFHYRIRICDYRIGLYLNKDVLEFTAFDHRKDIYKHFPLLILFLIITFGRLIIAHLCYKS